MSTPVSAVSARFGRLLVVNRLAGDRMRAELHDVADGKARNGRTPTIDAMRNLTRDPQIHVDQFIPHGTLTTGVYPDNRQDLYNEIHGKANAGLFRLTDKYDMVVTNDIDRSKKDRLGRHKPADFMDLDAFRTMLGNEIHPDHSEAARAFLSHERALEDKRALSPIPVQTINTDDVNERLHHYDRVETRTDGETVSRSTVGEPAFGRIEIIGPQTTEQVKAELGEYAHGHGPLRQGNAFSAVRGLRLGTGDSHLAAQYFNPGMPKPSSENTGVWPHVAPEADAALFPLPFGWGALITNDHRTSVNDTETAAGLDVGQYDDLNEIRSFAALADPQGGIEDPEQLTAVFIGYERNNDGKRSLSPIEVWQTSSLKEMDAVIAL